MKGMAGFDRMSENEKENIKLKNIYIFTQADDIEGWIVLTLIESQTFKFL